jgi:hypothetical protein
VQNRKTVYIHALVLHGLLQLLVPQERHHVQTLSLQELHLLVRLGQNVVHHVEFLLGPEPQHRTRVELPIVIHLVLLNAQNDPEIS